MNINKINKLVLNFHLFYPTNKISSVNLFNNYKKNLSQTNKLFRTILNFSFLKKILIFLFLCQLTFISNKTNLFELV